MSIFRPSSAVPRPRGITDAAPEVRPRGSRPTHAKALLTVISLASGCFQGDFRERHASTVDDYLATPFVDPDAPFSDPRRALGPPDGRTVALGVGAFVVLRFFRDIPDGPGFDLRVYEVGEDGAEARVAVSKEGDTFVEFARPASGTATTYDLEETGIDFAQFVRIRGIDDAGEEPGFDLDAVEALR